MIRLWVAKRIRFRWMQRFICSRDPKHFIPALLELVSHALDRNPAAGLLQAVDYRLDIRGQVRIVSQQWKYAHLRCSGTHRRNRLLVQLKRKNRRVQEEEM